METRDFLYEYVRKMSNNRSMSDTISGWRYFTYMKLAALTSYIKFECNFNEKGLCKTRNHEGSNANEKASMCCCSGCHNCIGFLYQLPQDFKIIEEYASFFNEKTGFWRAGSGCILPRSHRSPTCLTYNCDVNTSRSDAENHLLKCLRRREENVSIKGKRFSGGQYSFPAAMERWLKEEKTYTHKGVS